MRRFAFGSLFCFLALPALALDLPAARKAKLVCEKADGYVATMGAASADVAKLVAEVNDKRKQEYARISKENGQKLEVVQQLAALQIRQRGETPCP